MNKIEAEPQYKQTATVRTLHLRDCVRGCGCCFSLVIIYDKIVNL